MMDATLAALKRSARAILKDDLAAMRRKAKAKQAEVDELREKLVTALSDNRVMRLDLARVCNQRDVAEGQRRALQDRAHRAHEWALRNAQSLNTRQVLHCLTEWTYKGTGGPGFGIVHPFDRWGISPKP